MFKKIAPSCLPTSVCTTNQSAPQRGLVGHTVSAGSRALTALTEGELLNSALLGPCPGRSAACTKSPVLAAPAPLSGQLLSHGALGSCTGRRRRQQTDFIASDCFIKQSQPKQTQPHRQHTSSSFTLLLFPALGEQRG